MHRTRFAAGLTAAAAGLVLAACSDSSDSSPTSPMVASPETGAVITCNNTTFNNARNFARTYFVNSGGVSTQNTAVGYIDAIQGASGSTAAATRAANAFNLFGLVQAGVNVAANQQAAGSSMLNIVGQCAGLMSSDIDWTGALGSQGAFAVVGNGSSNVAGPVYAKDLFSAVAPPAKGWSAWLRLPAAGLPDARAVVAGAPFNVTPSLSPEAEVGTRGFDWFVIPERPFPFGTLADDDGFFQICVDSDITTTERVQNNHPTITGTIPGVLGTPNPANDPIALTCEGFENNGQPVQTVGLFRRVLNALAPQPAYAAALLGKKTGGTPGGFSRHFVVKPTALNVTVETVKDANVGATLNQGDNGITVTVTTAAGVPLQRAGLTISVFGNNGQPANLGGTHNLVTDEFGVAVFTNLKLFSAGGYVLKVEVTSGGLAGQAPVSGVSNQFHIKNKK